MSQCVERVWGPRVSDWRCNRGAGFGPKGEYCKQHAARHEKKKPNAVLFKIPANFIDWDKVTIEEMRVVSFTESTYMDEHGRRSNRKNDYDITFDTKQAAKTALLEKAEKELSRAKEKAAALEKALPRLKALL